MNRNPAGFLSRAGESPVAAVGTLFFMFVIVAAISPVAFFVLLKHGPVVIGIVLAATGLGLCLVDGLRLGPLETRWRLMASAALGLGTLSLLVLGLGTLGFLQRPLWITLLAAFTSLGIWRIVKTRRPAKSDQAETLPRGFLWFWPVAGVFGGLMLLAATLPPGILWPAEGNGYDVLEYHLGAPREYFEAGRIVYLPHNIYSNFPFNVEMPYLLAMVLHGSAIQAGLTAQILHAMLGILAVAAVWLAAREMGRGAGLVAGVMAVVCPLVVYVGALAYVECGLLFFSAMALAAIVRSIRADGSSTSKWMIVAGLCAGFACGCKYTSVPATLLPLAMAALWISMRRQPRSLAHFAAYIVAGLAALSPWLIKNAVHTGNPVFPLARGVFHERAGVWDDDGAARWQEGHLPAPEDRPLSARLRRTWQQVFGSSMFGAIMGLAVIAEIARRMIRRRIKDENEAAKVSSVACYSMLIVGLAAWLCFTHLVDRFAIVLLIPACILFARAAAALAPILRPWVIPLTVLAAAALNLKTLLGTFAEAHVFQILSARTTDGLDWFTEGEWPHADHIPRLNALTAAGKKVLMVGDAQRFYLDRGVDYCVVFNRNPFANAATGMTLPELIAWLQQQGYSHLYVDWGEMSRLRRSRYGFWKSIDVELFRGLQEQGLRPVENYVIDEDRPPYATLYELPAPRTNG